MDDLSEEEEERRKVRTKINVTRWFAVIMLIASGASLIAQLTMFYRNYFWVVQIAQIALLLFSLFLLSRARHSVG